MYQHRINPFPNISYPSLSYTILTGYNKFWIETGNLNFFQGNHTKEKTGAYHISSSYFLCHCITDSFLPIDIQPVLFVIYARFLYHYSITTLSLAI
ncbi:hypothetical protein DW973_01765 [Parabacteroides merdae]|nr:hypothetical protein DW973_01765 [Parabacteroides merdae]RHE90587.1 hypothetical protein DW705_15815 [Parabacteroides merdae]